MGRYLKYSEGNYSIDNQNVRIATKYGNSDINVITEQSTPQEISTFVSKKLVEFIEKELKKEKGSAIVVESVNVVP